VATSFTGRTVAVTDVHCGLAAGRDDCSFRLEAPRQMDFKMGVAQARKSSSGISGDSYLIRELPGNRLAAVLSDGTGVGPRAAEESRTTIRMLEELLRLGFDNEMAVRTINSMVLLRSSHERFATLDLLTADLYGGQARFVKIGAPPSYIRRGREVSVIQSPNLPLGVLPEVATDGSFVTLRPGDLVVMATDGLLAAAGERPVALGPEDGWLVSFLRDAGEAGPQEIADALIEAAVSLGSRSLAAVAGGGAGFGSYRGLRDDVTVVTLRFGPPEGG
jgi:stage II sporulation protein E